MNVYRSHRSTDPNIAYLFSELDNPGCRGTCIDVFVYICSCTTCIFPLAQVLHVVDNRQPKFDSVIQVYLNLTTSRSTMFVQHPCCFVFYQFILKMQFNPTTGRHINQRGVKTGSFHGTAGREIHCFFAAIQSRKIYKTHASRSAT
jgi:hypothetical protein